MKLTESLNSLLTTVVQRDHVCWIPTWNFLISCVILSLVVGCTPSSSSTATPVTADQEEDHHHDHGHRPESYTAALAQIKQARDKVKAAFDAGAPNECDNALHEVAEVLDVLPEVAAETDLPKEDWQVVNDQSKVLFDQFMKIHDGFHGDGHEGTSFAAVADVINKSIEVLESKADATGEKTPPTIGGLEHNHDHQHEQHEH